MLMKKVDEYLALRRAAGYALEVPEYHLRNFARFAAQHDQKLIRTPMVIEWASQAPSLNQREHRLQRLPASPGICKLRTRVIKYLPEVYFDVEEHGLHLIYGRRSR